MKTIGEQPKLIGVWVSSELATRIRARAKRQGRTVSQMLRHWLRQEFGGDDQRLAR